MVLELYHKKRKFKKTPEPVGEKGKKQGQKLAFCVQKHDASHLHYDFRLEYEGILLSWAVPKGPSMHPEDKRLAIHVEDHPLDYLAFHGTIPAGNYGAGTVELWDIGTYTPIKPIKEGLKKGHLEIELQGKKLKGTFSLIRLKQEDKQWLLIKGKEEKKSLKPVGKKGRKPKWVSPMLAKLIKKPFSDPDWLFEVKFDGYRAISFLHGDDVKIYSRNHNSFNAFYPKIVEALQKLELEAIVDGEIVSMDENGVSKFELLKNYQSDQEGHLCYYIFDLLYLNGLDLRDAPLIERKRLLEELLVKNRSSLLRYSDHFEEQGEALFKEAEKKRLEGIMAKKRSSPYVSKRTADWLKIKCVERQEVIILGFTEPKGSRQNFGSLLLGVYKGKTLHYIGHVGTGFDTKQLHEIHDKLKPLIVKKCPLKTPPKTNTSATWVKPKVICEVSFTEWTKDGKLRHPVFHGIREDKKAKEVKKEEKIAWK